MRRSSKSGLANADRSYSNQTDSEISYDPASGHIVSNDKRRHDDLKQMLDSNKDQLKLDAMRRIISLVARGRDFSDLYATVVKNVVSKNCEIRKLVCLFLIRYAEDQPDLALLPISTFQKAFKEPNQYIRADSVSTLSSIRVPLISQIILITITDAIVDLSPLVRKMAAIAITKIYSLGTAKQEDLEPLIAKLLCDHSLLVLNSAIIAFNEVCPHRLDFFHCKFKFLCRSLLDFDHWAQAVFLQIFTRYARDQFLDNRNNQKTINDYQLAENQRQQQSVRNAIESDFQLLLTMARPLIYSDNYAVSLAFVQFYYYCGTPADIGLLVKPILRALDAHAEIKQLFLDVATEVSAKNKTLFEPYVRHFFIQENDTVQTKQLKLTILTNLLNDNNQFIVLRELQAYLAFDDSQIVAAVIQAIGRCAHFSQRLRDVCVQGLIKLLEQKNETILSETILVLNDLLSSFGIRSNQVVIRMIQLLPNIRVAAARAAILSLSNQYYANIADACPHLPFTVARNFANEEYSGKLQIMNLVKKVYATNTKDSDTLCAYATKMAKYDRDYDVRDKTRNSSTIAEIEQLLDGRETEKQQRPNIEPNKFANDSNKQNAVPDCTTNIQFGTISFYFKEKLHYCHTVPEFRTHVPEIDPRYFEESVEDIEYTLLKNLKFTNEKKVTTSKSTDDKSEKIVQINEGAVKNEENSEDSSDSSSSSSSSSESESESESEPEVVEVESKENVAIGKYGKQSNIDLLLELDGCGGDGDGNSLSSMRTLPTLPPQTNPNEIGAAGDCKSLTILPANPAYVSYDEITLLDSSRGKGLQITYRFTRSKNLSSMSMVSIGLTFANTLEPDICNIQICRKYIKSGMMFHDFTPISLLKRSSPQSGTIAIDFSDSIQVATFEISTSIGSFTVSIIPKMGELLRPVSMTAATFQRERTRLCGLQELSERIPCEKAWDAINLLVLKTCNLAIHQSDSEMNTYCGVTASARTLLLLTIGRQSNQLTITINSEKITVASILLTELKQAFSAK